MSIYPNLKRAATTLGLPLGEVSWRNRHGIRLNAEALHEVDRELAKLARGEIVDYTIHVAAVAGLDYDAFQAPFLDKRVKDYRKRINEHDVVECALECIARSRK